MSCETVRTIYYADRQYRVLIFRRGDGTYGFCEERFSQASLERCWIPTGRHTESFCSSESIVLRESTGRIPWLGEMVSRFDDVDGLRMSRKLPIIEYDVPTAFAATWARDFQATGFEVRFYANPWGTPESFWPPAATEDDRGYGALAFWNGQCIGGITPSRSTDNGWTSCRIMAAGDLGLSLHFAVIASGGKNPRLERSPLACDEWIGLVGAPLMMFRFTGQRPPTDWSALLSGEFDYEENVGEEKGTQLIPC